MAKSPQRKRWAFCSIAVALGVFIPLATLLYYWFTPAEEWPHIVENVLSDYITNSLWLMLGVSLFSAIMGTSCAWLTAMFNFPGKTWLQWGLVLPMAFPTYIISFVYVEVLDFHGPVQSALRDITGWETMRDYYFPDIMSLPGAIMLIALVLYPYVYLIVRPVFQSYAYQLNEVAFTFGYSSWSSFLRISLPLARPAIVSGTSLALMEALNDFGTVSYFGIPTFTTGIYRAWSFLDLPSAARLSSLLMVFVLTLFVLERWQRRNQVFTTSQLKLDTKIKQLSGIRAWGATLWCLLPVIAGFVIPIVQLGVWAAEHNDILGKPEFYQLMLNSLGLALVISFIVVFIALLIRFGLRMAPSSAVRWGNRLGTMGYAMPGSVISVGILIPLATLDNGIDSIFRHLFDLPLGLIFSGTLLAITYGYIVRFLMVAYNSVDAGLSNVPEQLDQAAATLGHRPLYTAWKIDLPLIKRSVFAALMLVFIDIMKELPATLILRPSNFDTLATKTYELATEEMLPQSAIYALAIVVAGLIPVIFLTKLSGKTLQHPAETST